MPDFADWQSQNQSFEQMAAFSTGGSLLANNDEVERVRGTSVSAEFFPLFKTNALLGRTLQADDSEKDRAWVVVLSYGLWQRRFGGDPNVVGKQVKVAGRDTTIVGVMPAAFEYPAQTELWFPFHIDGAAERRDNRYIQVVTRLKTRSDARAGTGPPEHSQSAAD